MELWIRSQEKTRLIKVDNVLAYKFDDGSYGIQINGECFVGDYKTKERALEVLDEIQENIENQGKVILLTDESGIFNGSKFFSYVYEMPEE